MSYRIMVLSIVILSLLAGCAKDKATSPSSEVIPIITTIIPDTALIGDIISITGTNFGTSQSTGFVTFNDTKATEYTSWTDTQTKVKVPTGATSGKVWVEVNGKKSNEVDFIVANAVLITSVTPDSANFGNIVIIAGKKFGSSQNNSFVTFNDTKATEYMSWSDNEIQAKVPTGATSGKVVVMVNGKNSNGVDFKVTLTCNICHENKSDDLLLKYNQYDLSKHNTGIIYEEEDGIIACAGCHTGQGFAEAADAGIQDPLTHATGPINCQACHPIHTTYTKSDFSQRQKTGLNLRIGGAPVDLKKGNTCIKCHQGRTYNFPISDTTLKSTGTTTYSRLGPHYGTSGNIYTMNGPYKIAGSVSYPTSNPHSSLTNGCVDCHMETDAGNPGVGGHTFSMPGANMASITNKFCQICHDANRLNAGAVAKEVKSKLDLYRQKLIDKGFLDISQAGTGGTYNIFGEYLSASNVGVRYSNDDMKVTLNYLYIAKDRSFGAHNPYYVKALITNGLEYLNK